MRDFRHVVLGVALVLAACGNDGTGIPDQCNPLGGQGCLLPWPSAAFEVADSTTATGFRVAIDIAAMPTNIDGVAVDPTLLNRWDGFTASGPMLAEFPTGVSDANLPRWKNPDASLAADAPIVLLDMATGERAPFFAEVDHNIQNPLRRALIIHPLTRLHTSSHYVVAIRKSVKALDGTDLPIPEAFAAAVAGSGYDHPRFSRARYEGIFTALSAAGIERTDLVIAWDFHTASDQFLRSDLTTMRDAAIPAMGPSGASLTFNAVPQPPRAGLLRSFTGTFKSPNFLTNDEADDSKLRRAANGLPEMSGLRDARFAAIVPQCVTTQPLPRPTIVFGHGLFGSAEEYLNNNFVIDLAQNYCFVIVAGDFIGFTSRQFALAALAVNDLNKGAGITEKLTQSVIDFIALETITRGQFGQHAEFQYNGQSLIDPAKTFYVGGSLGGIMGNVFMAYDPNLTKGVLAVPGGVWSMLIERSNAWSLLIGSAQSAYEDPSVYELLIALLGMGMEPLDPITTAGNVLANPLPGVPPKRILMWYTLGDSLVTNISTEIVAREMGIDLLTPSVKSVWKLGEKSSPATNAIVVYDEHPTPLPSDYNIPPAKDNGTHSGVNNNPSALRQVEAFLLQDQIIQTCGGATPAPCDCATGACN